MADIIVYANLFDRLRELIRYFYELETRLVSTGAGGLPYIKNEILTKYEDLGLTSELQTMEADFSVSINAIETLKLAIIGWFETA